MTDSTTAKFEARLEVTAAVGENFEKMARAHDFAVHEARGASRALRHAAKAVSSQLSAALDQEWNDGAFRDCDSPDKARAKVKRAISRAVGLLENLQAMAANQELVNRGKADAMQAAVTIMGKYNDSAAARLRQLKLPPPSKSDISDLDGRGNPRRRPGERPQFPERRSISAPKKKKSAKKKSSTKRKRPPKAKLQEKES